MTQGQFSYTKPKNKKIFYLDTETTGVNSEINDIVQLAFAIEINGEVVEKHNLFMQPFSYSTIHPEALEKQNRTIEELKSFPPPSETYNKLINILSKHIDKYDKGDKFYPAGYNVRFDADFLNQFFRKNGNRYYGAYFNWKLVDPYPLLHLLDSMGFLALPDYKLGTVCKHYNIPIKAHDALEDIQATMTLIELVKTKYIFGKGFLNEKG